MDTIDCSLPHLTNTSWTVSLSSVRGLTLLFHIKTSKRLAILHTSDSTGIHITVTEIGLHSLLRPVTCTWYLESHIASTESREGKEFLEQFRGNRLVSQKRHSVFIPSISGGGRGYVIRALVWSNLPAFFFLRTVLTDCMETC